MFRKDLFNRHVLLRAFHKAQAKPANIIKPRRIFVLKKTTMPPTWRSSKDFGIVSLLKASPTPLQTKRAKEQEKKICFVVSSLPHKQQYGSPFHPLFFRATADCNLLWDNCQRKTLIFRGRFVFHKLSEFFTHTPLWVLNRYKLLVVKFLDLSRDHSTSSSICINCTGWRIANRSVSSRASVSVRHLHIAKRVGYWILRGNHPSRYLAKRRFVAHSALYESPPT